jgi:hypothetical protein
MEQELFEGSTKKLITDNERKIKKVIHQLSETSTIEQKIKNMLVLEYNPKHHLYQKLFKQLVDKFDFVLSDIEIIQLLFSLNPTLANYYETNKYSIIRSFQNSIQDIQEETEDVSSGKLNLSSLEFLYLSFDYQLTKEGNIDLDILLNPKESPINVDVLNVLQLENLIYSLEQRLTGVYLFFQTNDWNQMIILLCYEITKTQPIFYTQSNKSQFYEIQARLTKIHHFYDQLKNLYNKNKLKLNDYISILFLKFRALEVQNESNLYHMNQDKYIHLLLTNMEMFHNDLFLLLNLNQSNILDQFKKDLAIIYKNMEPFLQFPMKKELIEICVNTLYVPDTKFKCLDDYINLNVPYSNILENMNRFNRIHLSQMNLEMNLDKRDKVFSLQDIFLDFDEWKNISNFETEKYLDHLFLNHNLSLEHKYILAMKGILFFQRGQDIHSYTKRNQEYLIGAKYQINQNKKYKEEIEIKSIWNKDFVESLIYPSENIFVYYNLEHLPLESIIDFIIYYLIYSRQLPTFENIIDRLESYFPGKVIPSNIQFIFQELISLVPVIDNIKIQSNIQHSDDFTYKINNVYSLFLQKNLLIHQRLFTPESNFYDHLIKEGIKSNETGIVLEIFGSWDASGFNILTSEEKKIITGSTGSIDVSNVIVKNTESMLEFFLNERDTIFSINLNKDELDHYILDASNISLTSKLIYSIYTRPKNIIDLSANFGSIVSDYLVHGILNHDIFTQIYNRKNKITPFGLIYLILDYSFSISLSTRPNGKFVPFDIVSDIQLDLEDYLDQLEKEVKNHHTDLSIFIHQNRKIGENILTYRIYDHPVLNYYNNPDVYDMNNLYLKNIFKNTQTINGLNYINFINQFIEKNINNPYDALLFIIQFQYEKAIMTKIKETIKSNYSQYLSKNFYMDWAYQFKDASGNFNVIVPYTIGNLLKIQFLSEQEFFNFIKDYEEDTIQLYYFTKMFYDFTEDIEKFYRNQSENKQSTPQMNISPKVENILDMVNMMNFDSGRIPTQEMMRNLLKETPAIDITRSQEEIQKEMDKLERDKEALQNLDINDPITNERLEENYIRSGDAQGMLEYLNKQAQKRGQRSLDEEIKSYMTRWMILQMWLSMFDPTQVLVDYTFERLLNQGVLGEFIDQYKKDHPNLVMNLTYYPSSLVAKYMYERLKKVLEKEGTPVTKENMTNKLDTWTDDEKWEIEKTSFLLAKYWLQMIKNNNSINYSGSPNVSIKSKIKPITFEKAKMIVKDGGSGLLELRKI